MIQTPDRRRSARSRTFLNRIRLLLLGIAIPFGALQPSYGLFPDEVMVMKPVVAGVALLLMGWYMTALITREQSVFQEHRELPATHHADALAGASLNRLHHHAWNTALVIWTLALLLASSQLTTDMLTAGLTLAFGARTETLTTALILGWPAPYLVYTLWQRSRSTLEHAAQLRDDLQLKEEARHVIRTDGQAQGGALSLSVAADTTGGLTEADASATTRRDEDEARDETVGLRSREQSALHEIANTATSTSFDFDRRPATQHAPRDAHISSQGSRSSRDDHDAESVHVRQPHLAHTD